MIHTSRHPHGQIPTPAAHPETPYGPINRPRTRTATRDNRPHGAQYRHARVQPEHADADAGPHSTGPAATGKRIVADARA